jgi:uncharacterized paraquat-inducible protein A
MKGKIIVYLGIIFLLILMVYFGVKAYAQAKTYERTTTELVGYQSAEEQAKLTLESIAKSILGDWYEDERKHKIDKIRIKQNAAMNQAQQYTRYFMLVLFCLLLCYFFTSLRAFTLFGSIAAMITLFFGLLAPILMVTIHKEVEYLGDVVLSFESKGVIGSILKLWESEDFIVAGVILLFSVIIPMLKTFSLLFVSIFMESKFAHTIVRFFKVIGKWSMVDVFVVAVFLVYLTANKSDISHAQVEVGLYFFLAYVIVSMLMSLSADKMLRRLNSE